MPHSVSQEPVTLVRNLGSMTGRCPQRYTAALILFPMALAAESGSYSFGDAQNFLKARCSGCHSGATPAGNFDLKDIASPETIRSEGSRWKMLARRVGDGEMPPKGVPAPPADQRDQFVNWITASVRAAGCTSGAVPTAPAVRRLNRDEYAATVRDLLDIQVDITS